MRRQLWAFLFLVLLVLPATPILAQSNVPQLPGIVNDYTGRLGSDANSVADKAGQVVRDSHEKLNRLYVLFVPDLSGYTPDSFGDAVFKANNLGTGDVILTVSFNPRAVIVTNSKELDGLFHRTAPDCSSDWGAYVSTVMGPHLRDSRFGDGAKAGLDEIGRIVNQSQPNCQSAGGGIPSSGQQTAPVQQPSGGGIGLGTILIVLLVIVAIFLLIFPPVKLTESDGYVTTWTYRTRRGRHYGGYGGYGSGDYTPSYQWPSSSPSSSSHGSWGGGTGGSSSTSSFGGGGSSSSSSFGSSSGGSSSSSGGW